MRPLLYSLNDEPVLGGALGREKLVEQVSREIAMCELPQVFGIHGDWGAGKTSFLCAVERFITGSCRRLPACMQTSPHPSCIRVKVVWFEAWRYQNEPAPVVALLHEMCSQLGTIAKGRRQAKKLAFTAFRGIINMVRKVEFEPSFGGFSLGKLGNPIDSLNEASEEWESDHLSAPLSTERIRGLLDETIKQLIGWFSDSSARVLIIVDDLDRCSPQAAYRLLEGIKIYLSLESCAFLLGINQREVVRAIGEAKGGEKPSADKDQRKELRREAEVRGAEYLEKLCGVIWKLPLPRAEARGALLRLLLRPEANGRLKDVNPLPAALVDEIANLVMRHDCVAANPRKIKMFANALRSLAVAGLPEDTGDLQEGVELPIPADHAEALIIAAAVYAFHPKLLQFLQAHRSFFGELLQWARTGAEPVNIHDALQEMELLDSSIEQQSPTPILGERFADPTYGAIFRIQRLLNEAAAPPEPLYDLLVPYLNLPARGAIAFEEE